LGEHVAVGEQRVGRDDDRAAHGERETVGVEGLDQPYTGRRLRVESVGRDRRGAGCEEAGGKGDGGAAVHAGQSGGSRSFSSSSPRVLDESGWGAAPLPERADSAVGFVTWASGAQRDEPGWVRRGYAATGLSFSPSVASTRRIAQFAVSCS